MGSRILGLVREQVFAAFFGTGVAQAAFVVAFRIPNMLRDLFAEGALSAAFVTTFTQTLNQKGEREAWRLANLVNNALIVVLSLLTLVGIVMAPQLVNLLVGDSEFAGNAAERAEMIALAIKLTRILFPFLLMVSLAAVAMGILNTKGYYAIPASASTMFNVGSIIGGLVCAYGFAPEYITHIASALWHRQTVQGDPSGAMQAIVGMAIGTLIGGVLQWLIQVPSLRAVGYRWRWQVSFTDPSMRQVMRLMAPAIIGSAALQINLVVSTNFATSIGTEPANWLLFAFRLIYLPIGIFGVAISTATLPITSRAAALDDLTEFKTALGKALRLIFVLTIPSAVGLMVLSRPIIALIYERGKFTAFDTQQTGLALSYYALGLVAYSAIRVLTPSFYALKETRIPMYVSLASIATNYLVSALSVRVFGLGHRGLALSVSAVAIVSSVLLFMFLHRRVGALTDAKLWQTFIKVSLAASLMGGLCWLVSQQLERWLGTVSLSARFFDVSLSVGTGIIAFYLAARALRISEITALTNIFARKLGLRRAMP
jgi:putative peptidoglycan lipid II flippase